MLLARAFLREQGIALETVTFARTEAGKPFVVSLQSYHIVSINKPECD